MKRLESCVMSVGLLVAIIGGCIAAGFQASLLTCIGTAIITAGSLLLCTTFLVGWLASNDSPKTPSARSRFRWKRVQRRLVPWLEWGGLVFLILAVFIASDCKATSALSVGMVVGLKGVVLLCVGLRLGRRRWKTGTRPDEPKSVRKQ